MDSIKYFISGIITGLLLFFIMKVGSCNQELPNQEVVDSLTKKVDTLILRKDSLVYRYKESKKVVYLRDSIYLNDRTLENCDSLVKAQRIALKNCDTVINVSDTIIQTMVLRDSFRVETIKNINKRKLRLGAFGGLGFSNNGFGPTIGAGLVF
jgi:hypothetical protein